MLIGTNKRTGLAGRQEPRERLYAPQVVPDMANLQGASRGGGARLAPKTTSVRAGGRARRALLRSSGGRYDPGSTGHC